MELTQKIIDRYVGGQLEVQSTLDNYLYRGEIVSMELTGSGGDQELTVDFSWFAKMGSNFEWEVADVQQYKISMQIYSVSNIGSGRIMLSSSIIGETTILFPRNGSKLDPTKVHGLVLKT